jgi:outer membrane protein assembly factor BamB
MKNYYIILLLLLGFKSQAQTDSLKTEEISYNSMIITEDKILAIDNDGKLNIWNLNTLQKTYKSQNVNTFYLSVGKDKKGQFYLGTKKGEVLRLNSNDFSTSSIIKLKKDFWSVEDIVFNSKNKMFLILPFGVYDPIKDKLWKEFEHNGVLMHVSVRDKSGVEKILEKYFSNPEYTFLDSNDVLWMSKTFGEFGSVLQLFDTKNRKIIRDNDKLEYGYPKSIFEDEKKNIYITSGLSHFSQSGEIYKIKNYKTVKTFNSNELKDSEGNKLFEEKIFIGPGMYNILDRKLYISTTKGFYNADVSESDKIANLKFLFEPKLSWKQEPLAMGVDMSILKIEFIKGNRMVFLTSNDGIGVYDGIELRWLN